MNANRFPAKSFLIIAFIALLRISFAQETLQLTAAQQTEFLRDAKVIASNKTSKGITSPYRLTLTDGKITHDALFQSVDDRKNVMQFFNGRSEFNFVDSYLYNIAAYELAKLLGLDYMMPVTVKRKWDGKQGSLSWWLAVQMDEAERLKKKISPPNPETWNQQMYRLRVFAELTYDQDRNLTNVLISPDWKIYMIDFSRAFRLYHELKNPNDLIQCSRELLDNLRKLDAVQLSEKTGEYLNKMEIEGVMKRRDKIVNHFEKLIAEKGEAAILY